MVLVIDEEVQGNRKQFGSVEQIKNAVLGALDENVYEVQIKKRAPKSNSPVNQKEMFGKSPLTV